MAIPSDHLELSARLASRHRRRRPPAPRRARPGRWGARLRGSRLGRGRAFLGGVDARWQRSTVKASYSRNGRSASWAAHGTYLAREGAQRGGGKGRGFSAEQEGIDLPETLRNWQRAGDERLWKFIVSPEHAERLDLKAHTRALVSHIERDLGDAHRVGGHRSLQDRQPARSSPVRGRDARGQDLKIHPDYLRQGLRRRSQDLATQALGLSLGTRDRSGARAVHRTAPLHRGRLGTHPSRGDARTRDGRSSAGRSSNYTTGSCGCLTASGMARSFTLSFRLSPDGESTAYKPART